MIKIIRSEERHRANLGWLDTRWHFSFDQYYDPANVNWGALRVFNDDVIQPAQGFGMHGHRDMEIVTYVLDGELEHEDNHGHRGIIHAGEVQVMSAGTGIMHSKRNPSKAKPLHLLQIWIMPRTRGLKPRWEQRSFTAEERRGKLLPVVSDSAILGTFAIDQAAEIDIANLAAGEQATYKSQPGRKAYLFIITGDLALNGKSLSQGDQARIADETELNLQAGKDSELILLDLPEVEL